MRRVLPLTLAAAFLLSGCGTRPSVQDATGTPLYLGLPVSVPRLSAKAKRDELSLVTEPLRRVPLLPNRTADETDSPTLVAPADVAPDMGDPEDEPSEADDAPEPALEAPMVDDSPIAMDAPAVPEARAYGLAGQTNASGVVVGGGGQVAGNPWGEPVYLTPYYFPIIVPGSPCTVPAFTPHAVDTSHLPTNAFTALADDGRLRDRKRGWMAWLIGYSFPKIDASTARTRLLGGTTIYLSPNGSYFHRDKTYLARTTVTEIDAMLPELREEALEGAAKAARLKNIDDRAKLLPGFNGVYDVTKLMLLELFVDGYQYGGHPVRRGLITTANFYEQAKFRRAVAAWWEDNQACTASSMRASINRMLIEKFQQLGRDANYLAANPSSYSDAQLIPGLRDPRDLDNGNSYNRDADIAFNKQVIRDLAFTMPLLLSSTVYP